MNNNLISITDCSINEQKNLFYIANKGEKIYKEFYHFLDDRVLGSLFFQPSTRTQFSFQSAFVRLGGNYIGCSDISQTRSGPPYYETIEDLGRIISNYCDIIVMRTIDDLQTKQLCLGACVPIISAGSGNVEHPTQALTDLFTIHKSFGELSNHNILIIGTPRQRTINSFIKGMEMWGSNNYHILCQSGIYIDETIVDNLDKSSVLYYNSWSDIIDSGICKTLSIIYIDKFFYETHFHTKYVLDEERFKNVISNDAIILHPLPRTAELPKYVDNYSGARYFEQARNGLYIRSALFLSQFCL